MREVSTFLFKQIIANFKAKCSNKQIKLDEGFHRDLKWLKKFLVVFNGKSLYVKKQVDAEIHLDACLTVVGAVFKNQIYQAKLPEEHKQLDIAALEMLNILVALRLWAKDWSGLSIKIHCGNQAVVSTLNSGKTRDSDLASISRNILCCAQSLIFFS